MEKGFFKIFNPETSAEWIKIRTGYTNYKNEKLPQKVLLRDRFEKLWPIQVIKKEKDFYFQNGWKKFIEANTLEYGDFLIFDYDGKGTLYFKILGINGCEKNGVGGEKKEEEMNVEHQKSIKTIGKKWASDSDSSYSSNDSDKYCIVEEEDTKVVEKEEEEEAHERALCSKRKYVEEKEDDKKKGLKEEVEIEEMEHEEVNERADTCKKKVQRSKVGCQNTTACKVGDVLDHYGVDIFKSGRANKPRNPYFVVTINAKKEKSTVHSNGCGERLQTRNSLPASLFATLMAENLRQD